MKVRLTIKHLQDFRNYKVSTGKATNVLSFKPQHDVASILGDLIRHKEGFSDFANPLYYNIQVFRNLIDHSD